MKTSNPLNYGTEKTWKSLFKFAAIFCFIVIAVVVVKIAAPQLFFKALVKKRYFEKEGYVEILEYNFQKHGCYSIGIASKSEKMKWFHTAGNYQVEFLNPSGEIIETINIKENRLSTNSKSFRSLGMHVFEIPYQGKYSNLKIRYTVITADKTLKTIDDRMYLYLNPTYVMCGKEFEKKENIKKYGIINYVEKDPAFSPLYTAIKNDDVSTVKNIIQTYNNTFSVKMPGNREPIHYAAYFNSSEVLEYFIKQGAIQNTTDINGFTPVQYAISNNSVEAASILLKKGINLIEIHKVPNVLSGFLDKYTPIDVLPYAVLICSTELTQVLIDSGFDLSKGTKMLSGEELTFMDFLNRQGCRYNYYTEETNELKINFNKMKLLLESKGAKKSPVKKLTPAYVGQKEK